MPLTEGQVQIGTLVMGPDTGYRLYNFDPWSRTVRADQGDARAWNHGSWSGAEWTDQAVVPMLIRVQDSTAPGAATWLTLHQALAAAFKASSEDIELRWVTGGTEFLLRGRPRMVEPTIKTLARGSIVTKAAFVALDPRIYSGDLYSVVVTLPIVTGGLTVPLAAPFTIDATVLSGRTQITNAGTETVGLMLRVDGPVPDPRISLLANGITSTLTVGLTLDAGQWLDIDTASRTVYLNGTASRRGLAYGDFPLLPPGGPYDLAFDASGYDASAQLTVSWRDAWH